MRQLIILRHGEAETGIGMADFERALTARGEGDVRDTGNRLQKSGCVPDAVFSSPALRARTTAAIAVEATGARPDCLTLDERIYHAMPDTILDILAFADPGLGRIMIVGHNPTFQMLAHGFAAGAAIIAMRPATAVVVDVACEWAALTPRSGAVSAVIEP